MAEKFEVGKFSPKAVDSIKNSNAFINIFHGAVRSSKTINANIAFINHIATSPYDEFLLIGKTERTIYRNVIADIQKMVYPRKAPYNRATAELRLFGKRIYVVGAKDIQSVDKIKGVTVAGVYMDEVTTLPKNSVEMAISRASLPGSKIFMTTNPDSPLHYIKKEYIDDIKLHEDGIVKDWHFELKDNPNLPPDYVDTLSKIYKGVFYQRNVLGLWVAAEGAIYPMFSEHKHTFIKPPFDEYDNYSVGMDYGTATACAFGLFGLKEVGEDVHYHLLKEYYHDAEKTGKTLSDAQYADAMVKFVKDYPDAHVYCSHDATSLLVELRNRGLNVSSYKPNTLNDIKKIQTIMDEGRFLISDTCVNSIEQAQNYTWDLKAQAKGIEKPLKVGDHCCDMWRAPMCSNKKRMRVYI